MNRECEQIRPLISEYVDDALEAGRRPLVEGHLHSCADCAALLEGFRANKARLASLALKQTSAGFDAALAQRIAALNAPPRRRSWLDAFRMPSLGVAVLRPAVAGVALAGIAIGVVIHGITPRTSVEIQKPQPDLISQCVAQHRSYVESQPLTDWSAQALAGQTETADSSTAAGSGGNLDSTDTAQSVDDTL
jgi:anti-sigma factor RsiW